MSDQVPLRLLAHARAGDKGDTSNIAVFALNPAHYGHLCDVLTEKAVAGALAGLARGGVTRYRVENLHALNFVIRQALEGGVNRSPQSRQPWQELEQPASVDARAAPARLERLTA